MKPKRIVSLLLLAALGPGAVAEQTGRNPAQKEYFTEGFPKQFVFRGEYAKAGNNSYEEFEQAAAFTCGIIRKYVPFDEMPRVDPTRTAGYAARYAREHPEKLLLLHWDAEEHCNGIKGSSDRYFPGHWYTFKGSRLTGRLDKSDQWVPVEDAAPFSPTTKNPKARSQWLNPMVLILKTDPEGLPDWNRFEYAELDSVDVAGKRLKIKRGQALSQAEKFEKGDRIAPIATYLSSTHLFGYNFSTASPRDKKGKQAADIIFDELADLFHPKKGLLKDLDGIAFDVLNWELPFAGESVDSDGDGIPDGGRDPQTGENLWRKGALAFQERLREYFGEDFILTNDCYNEKDQRAAGIFNGFESEGLVRHNDAFRGFSKTLNVASYWMENNPAKYRMGYIVTKVMNPADMPRKEQFIRLCNATAACLGIATTREVTLDKADIADEITGGDLNRIYWLGRPVSEMKNLALDKADLLKGSGEELSPSFTSKWSAENASLSFENGEIILRGDGKNGPVSMRYDGFREGETGTDITVSFEVLSLGGRPGEPASIPNLIRFQAEGLPDYEKSPVLNAMYNNLWALCDTQNYVPVTFYFRETGGRPLNFVLSSENPSGVKIRNFRIHAGASALAREFEYGMVLVNPSLSPLEFDLKELFPHNNDWEDVKDTYTIGTCYTIYRRIKGKSEPNTGEDTGKKITLEPLSGIFLKKHE